MSCFRVSSNLLSCFTTSSHALKWCISLFYDIGITHSQIGILSSVKAVVFRYSLISRGEQSVQTSVNDLFCQPLYSLSMSVNRHGGNDSVLPYLSRSIFLSFAFAISFNGFSLARFLNLSICFLILSFPRSLVLVFSIAFLKATSTIFTLSA